MKLTTEEAFRFVKVGPPPPPPDLKIGPKIELHVGLPAAFVEHCRGPVVFELVPALRKALDLFRSGQHARIEEIVERGEATWHPFLAVNAYSLPGTGPIADEIHEMIRGLDFPGGLLVFSILLEFTPLRYLPWQPGGRSKIDRRRRVPANVVVGPWGQCSPQSPPCRRRAIPE